MKYAIFCQYDTGNLGDEIQSLATLSLLPDVNYQVNRENWEDIYDRNFQPVDVNTIEEDVLLIGNGWQIHNLSAIKKCNKFRYMPFSIHFAPHVANDLIKTMEPFFDKNRTIQVRDKFTETKLQSEGIQSVFLGCLTCVMDWNNLGITITHPSERKGCAYIDVQLPSDATIDDKYFSHLYQNLSVKESFAFARLRLQQYTKFEKIITNRLHVYLPLSQIGMNVELVGHIDERKMDFIHTKIDTKKLLDTFQSELTFYSESSNS